MTLGQPHLLYWVAVSRIGGGRRLVSLPKVFRVAVLIRYIGTEKRSVTLPVPTFLVFKKGIFKMNEVF